MSQQNYEGKDVSLNSDALTNALNEIAKEESDKAKEVASQLKKNLNKSYDPYIPLEKIAPTINEADKHSDMLSLGVSGIFFSLAIFMLIITFTQYSEFFAIITVLSLIAGFIASFGIIGTSSNKLRKAQNDLINLRLTFHDKKVLETLLTERKSKSNVGVGIFVVSSFLAIASTIIIGSSLFYDFAIIPFFLFIAFGSFILNRTSMRASTLRKILNTTQN